MYRYIFLYSNGDENPRVCMLFHRQRLGIIILFLSDVVILFLTLLIAIQIRRVLPNIIPGYPVFFIKFEFFWWFFPVWMAILIHEGAYTKKLTFWDEVKLLWRTSFFSTVAILTIVSLGKISYPLSRTFILLIGLLTLVLFPLFRISLKRWILRIGLLKSKVLILGTNDIAKRTVDALQKEPNMGYEVIGYIEDNESSPKKEINGIKVHGHLDLVERYLKNCDIQDIVIAIQGIDKSTLAELINKLQHKARSVLYVPDLSGMAVIGTEVVHFFQDQFIALEIRNNLAQPINYFVKKVFDYIVSLFLFLLFIIPLSVIALLIKITSQGPAIFKQQRLGKDGRLFLCYKFRTMYQDADERIKTIIATDREAREEWQTFWKLRNDPRITKIGNFLRKTSLDELPQIWNVLKGEMSLVGPRPYLPREWDCLKDHSEIIHSVHPGITGLWQVSGRSDSSYEKRISLDSWYVRNWNLWLDIVILIRTIRVVLIKEGAW